MTRWKGSCVESRRSKLQNGATHDVCGRRRHSNANILHTPPSDSYLHHPEETSADRAFESEATASMDWDGSLQSVPRSFTSDNLSFQADETYQENWLSLSERVPESSQIHYPLSEPVVTNMFWDMLRSIFEEDTVTSTLDEGVLMNVCILTKTLG